MYTKFIPTVDQDLKKGDLIRNLSNTPNRINLIVKVIEKDNGYEIHSIRYADTKLEWVNEDGLSHNRTNAKYVYGKRVRPFLVCRNRSRWGWTVVREVTDCPIPVDNKQTINHMLALYNDDEKSYYYGGTNASNETQPV
jgi:hypothetical protein